MGSQPSLLPAPAAASFAPTPRAPAAPTMASLVHQRSLNALAPSALRPPVSALTRGGGGGYGAGGRPRAPGENDLRTAGALRRYLAAHAAAPEDRSDADPQQQQQLAGMVPGSGLFALQSEYAKHSYRTFRHLAATAAPLTAPGGDSAAAAADNLADLTPWDISHRVDETLGRQLGIVDHIEAWAENVKVWLVRTVVVPLHLDVQQADAFFAQHAASLPNAHAFCCNAPLSEPHVTGSFGASKTRAQFLEEAYMGLPKNTPEARTILRRVALERYLDLTANPFLRPRHGMSPDPALLRHYALLRIQDFASDPLLGRCDLDRGKDFQLPDGRVVAWADSHLPTDALLLLHLFCAYFDEHTPAIGGLPFMRRHFVDCEGGGLRQALAGSPSSVAVVHTICHRKPYFCVLSRLTPDRRPATRPSAPGAPQPAAPVLGAGDVFQYYTKQTRNTLFQALAVFLYLHKAANNGILDTADITKPPFDLGRLLVA